MSHAPAALVFSAIVVFSVLGCGAAGSAPQLRREMLAQADAAKPAAAPAAQKGEADAPATTAAPRQIIYTAEVSLVTTDFDQLETRLPAVVSEQQGFIAQASVDRTSGARRTGRWTLRVPADRFQAMLAAIDLLGYPETRRQSSDDVTAEAIDLDARLVNARKLESGIAKLLETRSGKIGDVIEVERELGRIRGEIERMEARKRWLTDQSALSTITLVVREQQTFVPPAAPTLVSRVTDAWSGSLAGLTQLAQAILIGVVAATPWVLTMLVVGGLPLLIVLRGASRRGRAT